MDGAVESAVAVAGGPQPHARRAGGVRDRGESGVAGEGGLAAEPVDVGGPRR